VLGISMYMRYIDLIEFLGEILMSAKKIILDCDPGHDDAVAILLALASPKEIELLGITCVAGNVPLDRTRINALRVCELVERTDISVYSGCERPLVRFLVTAEQVHGQTGLDLPDGSTLPEPTTALATGHAVDFIIETLMAHPAGSITLCPTGPLTNIALAMVREPAITTRIGEIVLMGGAAITPGNVTPSAEFNIYVDPHAADVVFSSGAPLVMMGLDVTHQVLVTQERKEAIQSLGNRAGATVADLLTFYCSHDLEKYAMNGGPLHDPCVIAHLIDDTLFDLKHVNVVIETGSPLALGETVADWWGVTDRPANCRVAHYANHERFFALLTERLARLP